MRKRDAVGRDFPASSEASLERLQFKNATAQMHHFNGVIIVPLPDYENCEDCRAAAGEVER